jgi:hypothetical protein
MNQSSDLAVVRINIDNAITNYLSVVNDINSGNERIGFTIEQKEGEDPETKPIYKGPGVETLTMDDIHDKAVEGVANLFIYLPNKPEENQTTEEETSQGTE